MSFEKNIEGGNGELRRAAEDQIHSSIVRCPLSVVICPSSTDRRQAAQHFRLPFKSLFRRGARMDNGPRTKDKFSPFSRLHHLSDLALNRVPLEPAQVLNKEYAVQVVGLVAKGAREQAFAGAGEILSGQVLRSHRGVERPRRLGAEVGQAQAAFFFRLTALDGDNFGV